MGPGPRHRQSCGGGKSDKPFDLAPEQTVLAIDSEARPTCVRLVHVLVTPPPHTGCCNETGASTPESEETSGWMDPGFLSPLDPGAIPEPIPVAGGDLQRRS